MDAHSRTTFEAHVRRSRRNEARGVGFAVNDQLSASALELLSSDAEATVAPGARETIAGMETSS